MSLDLALKYVFFIAISFAIQPTNAQTREVNYSELDLRIDYFMIKNQDMFELTKGDSVYVFWNIQKSGGCSFKLLWSERALYGHFRDAFIWTPLESEVLHLGTGNYAIELNFQIRPIPTNMWYETLNNDTVNTINYSREYIDIQELNSFRRRQRKSIEQYIKNTNN